MVIALRPAAQSARKRLMEGMQAVTIDRFNAQDVQTEGMIACQVRS